MYKLICIDIDDTLINDKRQVTEGTKAALAAAIQRGVTVTLATGRMHASAQQLAKQMELNVPLISYQGSLIKNAMDGKVLYERAVPEEATRIIFDFCEANGLHLQYYIQDQLYTKADNERTRAYCELSNIPFTVEPDFSKLLASPSTKLLIYEDSDKLDELMPEFARLLEGKNVHMTKSKPYFLEFTHKEGTKGQAVAHLAKHIGCELSEVIAIGDSWNDRDMLEVAGLGVAMGNAVDALKEIADYITLSNNEDGVKHVIDKYVLNAVEAEK
ncbi:Cof-type HAD-IIB family hydrolase [Paenibacillus sp. y28]|uniref:Cof-type HAD-IIB family hydrolase n=1 Tax=Paenibacillus sp. y28 TaxID=3129110 RepID=UPI0030165A02